MEPRTGPAALTEDPGEETGLLGKAELQSEVDKVEDVEAGISRRAEMVRR